MDQDFNQNIDQALNRNVASENYADPLLYRSGKVAARKPEVFSESMNIDEWIESLKAYLAGTNPNAATDQVLIAQVKSFLSSTALKRVKHIFRYDVCDWRQLKKWMELAFNRHGLKYETILAKFLVREQHADESFASYYEELWALCDELTALRGADDTDQALTETRVMNQFAQGIHDRLVRSDVKRYIAQHGMNNICSMDVLEAASDVAKDHAVEEQYAHTYRESVEFLNKRVEEKNTKLKVSNVNLQSQRPDHSTPKESQYRSNRNYDEQRPTSSYREKQVEFKKRRNSQVVCYRCQQPGHISQGCRNQRVIVDNKRDNQSESKIDEAGKSKRDTPNGENKTLERNNKSVRQTRFEERLDDVSGSSDDSSGESGTEARANSIANIDNIEKNG